MSKTRRVTTEMTSSANISLFEISIGIFLFGMLFTDVSRGAAPSSTNGVAAGAPSSCSGGGDLTLGQNASGEFDKFLEDQITAEGLDKTTPSEFAFECQKADPKVVWREFLRGLATVESQGKSCGPCGDNNKSCGIFQMTGTDTCGGGNTFGGDQAKTHDAKLNITCAVKTWKSIMQDGSGHGKPSSNQRVGREQTGMIKGNPYWGPCKIENQMAMCDKIINTVKSKVCAGGATTAYIDWNTENPRSAMAGAKQSVFENFSIAKFRFEKEVRLGMIVYMHLFMFIFVGFSFEPAHSKVLKSNSTAEVKCNVSINRVKGDDYLEFYSQLDPKKSNRSIFKVCELKTEVRKHKRVVLGLGKKQTGNSFEVECKGKLNCEGKVIEVSFSKVPSDQMTFITDRSVVEAIFENCEQAVKLVKWKPGYKTFSDICIK